MDNVTQFPEPEKAPPLLFGPFTTWHVVVQGRVVPKLTGYKTDDGRVHLTLDGRMGADFPDEETAGQAAWLIANAMAIGAGYSHLEADSKDMPFAPKLMQMGPTPPASGEGDGHE